jgi:hypothetical protein
MVQNMLDANERKSEVMQQELYNNADAYASDNLNRLMGIPQFGYNGTKAKEGTELKGF